jgi:hypothetical protein
MSFQCPKPKLLMQERPALPTAGNRRPTPTNNKGPTPKTTGGVGTKPQVKAKVYALNKEELNEGATMVDGTLSLQGKLVTVLFETGSTNLS